MWYLTLQRPPQLKSLSWDKTGLALTVVALVYVGLFIKLFIYPVWLTLTNRKSLFAFSTILNRYS